jgi:PTH1 family peptidyl-tRNA hydrolase
MGFLRGIIGRQSAAETVPDGLRMVVGLGNPGPEYARNRHNAGFQVVDVLAERHHLAWDGFQKRSRTTNGKIVLPGGQIVRVLLAKPMTYMNASGESVGPLASWYKVAPENMLVVCDDLDLPIGRIRLRSGGGSGGQRGMQSIIRSISSESFPRLRVGIGRPPGQMDPADYVLQNFSTAQEEEMQIVRQRAADAIELWLAEGIDAAMNRCNGE